MKRLARLQQNGLLGVILLLSAFLAFRAPQITDPVSHQTVNGFLNPGTLFQVFKDTSFFAVLACGIALVIITGGIDLSVGSIYALSGVLTAMVLRNSQLGAASAAVSLVLCLGIGLLCGLVNGGLVTALGVHPFVITLGTMWVFRGIAFVSSKAESILLPLPVTEALKANLGLRKDLFPIPILVMVATVAIVAVFLARTTPGRSIYAVGGNAEASHYAGVRVPRVLLLVYTLCGLCAGLAAFLGSGYYGSASCSDGQGYELYAIASAVVGGVSLLGGRGSVVGAALGSLLIVLFRQGVVTLNLDTQYEWIIIGVAIIVAVFLEKLTRKSSTPA